MRVHPLLFLHHQRQNRQTIDAAQTLVENGLSSVVSNDPKTGPQWDLESTLRETHGPDTHLDPLQGNS